MQANHRLFHRLEPALHWFRFCSCVNSGISTWLVSADLLSDAQGGHGLPTAMQQPGGERCSQTSFSLIISAARVFIDFV
jgi:hypothetical protein